MVNRRLNKFIQNYKSRWKNQGIIILKLNPLRLTTTNLKFKWSL